MLARSMAFLPCRKSRLHATEYMQKTGSSFCHKATALLYRKNQPNPFLHSRSRDACFGILASAGTHSGRQVHCDMSIAIKSPPSHGVSAASRRRPEETIRKKWAWFQAILTQQVADLHICLVTQQCLTNLPSYMNLRLDKKQKGGTRRKATPAKRRVKGGPRSSFLLWERAKDLCCRGARSSWLDLFRSKLMFPVIFQKAPTTRQVSEKQVRAATEKAVPHFPARDENATVPCGLLPAGDPRCPRLLYRVLRIVPYS